MYSWRNNVKIYKFSRQFEIWSNYYVWKLFQLLGIYPKPWRYLWFIEAHNYKIYLVRKIFYIISECINVLCINHVLNVLFHNGLRSTSMWEKLRTCLLLLLKLSNIFSALLFFFNFVFVFETMFLCSFSACPGTSSVDQADLDLTEICLFWPPECWN